LVPLLVRGRTLPNLSMFQAVLLYFLQEIPADIPIGNERISVALSSSNVNIQQFPATNLNGETGNGLNADPDLGYSVSDAGDMNGDGKNDIIIGAYGALNDAGQAYVMFGSSSFNSSFNLNALNGQNGFIINALNADSYLGYSVLLLH